MTKNKQKKIKLDTYHSEDEMEIKHFIIILAIIIIFILGIYLFTRIFVTKDLITKETEKEPITGAINYNTTLIGNALNKPEEEYFVIIYNREDLNAPYYSSLASNYSSNKDALRVYSADLKNEFNKKYYDKDNLNLNPSDISDLKVGDLTLLKISKKKITNAYSNEEEIAKVLARVVDEDTKD
ncbi:MAG: hypothetical protein NC483_04885 [Ruminococcus sp.]|nr:hypothetical protein [Ruminococcus sp.]